MASAAPHAEMLAAFPYTPYEIQQQLMINLYEALQQKQVGLFESPTGTGKTLSIICSTLKWLEDEHQALAAAAAAEAAKAAEEDAALPDWMQNFGGNHPAAQPDHQPAQKAKQSNKQQQRRQVQLSQFVGELHRTRFADSVMLVAVGSRRNLCVNDEVLRLGELSQINERCLDLQRSRASSSRKAAAAAAAASTSAAASDSKGGVVGLMQQPVKQRSRQRQRQAKAGCPFLAVEGGAAAWEEFGELVLAAPIDVEELASMGRRKKVCPYYGSRRAVPAVDVVLAPYSSVLLPEARDSLGIQLQGSVVVFDEAHNLLDAINGAHSTAVSAWQLLSVQRSLSAYFERFKAFLAPTNAQNLQLLLRIAAALHGCLARQQQQQATTSQPAAGLVAAAAGRVVGVNDLLFDLGLDNVNMFELARWVRDNKMAFKVSGYTAVAVGQAAGSVELQQNKKQQQQQQQQQKQQASEVTNAEADAGPQSQQQQQQQQQQQLGQLSARDGVSAIHSFVSFLLSLTSTDADGRVIIEPAAATPPAAAAAAAIGDSTREADLSSSAAAQPARGGRMRYVLLNAARHFGRLLASARSVLLVSGTLAPVEGLRAQLFPDLLPERLRHFECGHVVPPDQLLAVCVGAGPSGKALNLRHESRGDGAVIDELGQLLLNLAAVVPEGLVVFAPSFGYLEALAGRWQGSGLLARLQQRKQLFREPRSATEVEQVLTAYAAACCPAAATPAQQPSTQAAAAPAAGGSAAGPSGAVMLCVVGGKLSEGINFGDGLGRCVVMLGMPYPNPSDLELKERMAYLDKQAAAAAAPAAAASAAPPPPAAVNQCVGRVVRHKGDYAAVVMVDSRWVAGPAQWAAAQQQQQQQQGGRQLPVQKLPGWVQRSFVPTAGEFGQAYKLLAQFYALQRQRTA
ncbi:hypothetical protein OEZ85_008578 [Tetradesmus obliquus]|uniref:Helicase ATP-binding domain-containing protein n=1 Tax=Tetradesmus obliquus TaxID=3088 RepID=A0ABY8TL68_TETOB|nr:hypothetical protein OEZ85_008578 [Tetradesmus obliquus]